MKAAKAAKWLPEFIDDLGRFARTLDSLSDTSSLANELTGAIGIVNGRAQISEMDGDTGRRYRSIRFPELLIVPPKSKQLQPSATKITRATIQLLYECYEEIDKPTKMGNDDLDRIRRADFQVCVHGDVAFGTRTVAVEDHWRVDTHYYTKGVPNEPHPWCHYQRGGHAQDSFSQNDGFVPGDCLASVSPVGMQLRALMQTGSPRIAAPPMDPICAIDFVIAQHDGGVWRSLWALPEYEMLVRKAQNRLWKPYFEFIAEEKHRSRLMPFFGGATPLAAG
jgi:hypothetical protein